MKINCDMGESFGSWKMGDDEEIMPFLDMANIACGMHASDPSVMLKTVKLAIDNQVKIGAHPGYNDLQGFGRRNITMPMDELKTLFIYQLGALNAICQSQGVQIEYVKPHGALYNTMMRDEQTFVALLEALKSYDKNLPLVLMAVPDFQKYTDLAKQYDIKLCFEAFVDRAYDDNGRLVARSVENACYHSLQQIQQQAEQIIKQKSVRTLNGNIINIHADTLCIHGDGPLAVQIASYLRSILVY